MTGPTLPSEENSSKNTTSTTNPNSIVIKAAIFDMDGLLINSEPFWQEAEKLVFAIVGIKLTTAMCEQTMGLRIDEVVRYWYNQKPWSNYSLIEIENQIMDEVEKLITLKGEQLEGVDYIINFFKEKQIPMAVASSSKMKIINTVMRKLNLAEKFNIIHSAEFEPFGKPHPGIFITTAEKLNVKPEDCIVFEDSFNGLIAAKAARMKAVAIPDKSLYDQQKLCIADLKLRSLMEFNESHLKNISTSFIHAVM